MDSSSAPVHLIPFARSVINLLTVWPALQLSFEQSDAHQSTTLQNDARSELATELVGAFLDAQPTGLLEGLASELVTPDQNDIEDFLLSWIFGTLDVRIEDESEISISRDLIRLWKEWSQMKTAEDEEVVRSQGPLIQQIEQLTAKRQQTQGSRIKAQLVDEGHISDDDLSEAEDSMQVDKPLNTSNHPPRRASPIIDEDGFTVVTKPTRRH